MRRLEAVKLDLEELEALRLADFEHLHHADAGARMGVSRQTFGRLLRQARSKTADALLHGKTLLLDDSRSAVPRSGAPVSGQARRSGR